MSDGLWPHGNSWEAPTCVLSVLHQRQYLTFDTLKFSVSIIMYYSISYTEDLQQGCYDFKKSQIKRESFVVAKRWSAGVEGIFIIVESMIWSISLWNLSRCWNGAAFTGATCGHSKPSQVRFHRNGLCKTVLTDLQDCTSRFSYTYSDPKKCLNT